MYLTDRVGYTNDHMAFLSLVYKKHQLSVYSTPLIYTNKTVTQV
jgi:hypothetical protein